MQTLSAASRRNSNASSSSSSSPRVSLSGAYTSRMSSLGEDTPFTTDTESAKSETPSRSITNELKNDKCEINTNLTNGNGLSKYDKLAENSDSTNECKDQEQFKLRNHGLLKCDKSTGNSNPTNENNDQEQSKLRNPTKGLHKSVAFKDAYSSDTPLTNNCQVTRPCRNENRSILSSNNRTNKLESDRNSSSGNDSKTRISLLNSAAKVSASLENNNLNAKCLSSKLDNIRQIKNKSNAVTSNNECTNISKSINGKNNLLNENSKANKISKLSDTAKIRTAERLKMFEQLSAPTCTSKMRKETLVSNKTNFQKAVAFWNRE